MLFDNLITDLFAYSDKNIGNIKLIIVQDNNFRLEFCTIIFIFSSFLNNHTNNFINFTGLKIFVVVENNIELVVAQLKLISLDSFLYHVLFGNRKNVVIINEET